LPVVTFVAVLVLDSSQSVAGMTVDAKMNWMT
jgi:hypothetical protein